MKYGIKHNQSVVKAISKFSLEVPENFIEISREKYDEFIAILNTNNSVFYNVSENTLIVNSSEEEAINLAAQKEALKDRLRFLSIEIDTLTKMGESVVDLEDEFKDVLADFNKTKQM